MEIFKISGIIIIGVFLSIMVKGYNKELGICITLSVFTVTFCYLLPRLQEVLCGIETIVADSGLNPTYLKTVIKIIGIAYISQFTAELAKDSGEGLLSKKAEFAGKIVIAAVMLPIIRGLLSSLFQLLTSI